MIKSRLKRNFGVLLAAQVYGQALAALLGLVTVRWLGPTEYGRYTLAVVGLNLGAVVADAGLSSYLGREVARVEAATGRALWQQALGLRLALSGLVGLLTVGLVWLFPAFGQPGLAFLAGLTLLPISVIILTTAFLNGQSRVPFSAGLSVLVGTLNFGLTLVGLLWRPVAGVVLATTLAANLAGVMVIWRMLRGPLTGLPPVLTAMALLRASRSFWLIGLAGVVFQYADVYVVAALLDEGQVGQYGAALRFLTLLTLIPTVWGVVAVPRFARQPDRLRAELTRWGWGLGLSGIGLALLGLVVTEPIVTLLLGAKYEAAGQSLSGLTWAGAAIFASAAPVTWLTVTNRQHLVLIALVIADLVGLTATVGLAGGLHLGLTGATAARVLASWTLFGLYLFFCFNTRNKESIRKTTESDTQEMYSK